MLSGIALSDVLDSESNNGLLLLLGARVEASVGALAEGKRVVSLVNAWHVSNAKLLTEIALKLHGHLDGTAASAKLTKRFSVAVEEVDDAFADGIISVAFKTLGSKEANTPTDKAFKM